MTYERYVLEELVCRHADREGIGKREWCKRRGLNFNSIGASPSHLKYDLNMRTLYQWCEALGVEPWKVVYKAGQLQKEAEPQK